MFSKKLSAYYPLVMRFSLAFVLGWFGINEVLDPRYWSGYVPPMIIKTAPLDVFILVQIHGVLLVILSLTLFFRFFLRIFGLLIMFTLLSIIGGLISMNGFDEIVVRDIGLFGLALSIWLYEIKEKQK